MPEGIVINSLRGDLWCDGEAVKGSPHIRGSVNESSCREAGGRKGGGKGRKEKGRERERDKAVNQGSFGCKGCAPRTF